MHFVSICILCTTETLDMHTWLNDLPKTATDMPTNMEKLHIYTRSVCDPNCKMCVHIIVFVYYLASQFTMLVMCQGSMVTDRLVFVTFHSDSLQSTLGLYISTTHSTSELMPSRTEELGNSPRKA